MTGVHEKFINLMFKNGNKLESAVVQGKIEYSEAGEIIFVVLDTNNDLVDVLRRMLLRVKDRHVEDADARAQPEPNGQSPHP